MHNAVRNVPRWAVAALFVIVPAATGADLSKYRNFPFGAGLTAVAAQIGVNASEAKVIHRRPALIQELEWRPQPLGPSASKESASDVVFTFLTGALYRIEIKYDRYEIEGMTLDDVVDAVSAVYGPATRPAPAGARDGHEYRDEVAAQWEDPQYRFDLIRSPSAGSFRLIGVLKSAEASAKAATLEAKRLDDVEAPQRDAARIAGEQSAAAALLEKARTANKPRFRP